MSRMLRFSEEQLAFLRKRMNRAGEIVPPTAAPKKAKYSNRKTEVDGITFDSAREAKRHRELDLLYKAGQISRPARQVRFPLPGKTAYVADFLYLEKRPLAPPALVVEDVKGVKTEVYKLKKRQMLDVWGIEILES